MEEPRFLFSEYADIIEIDFLGIDAIELWKQWLYACPEMVPVQSNERTLEKDQALSIAKNLPIDCRMMIYSELGMAHEVVQWFQESLKTNKYYRPYPSLDFHVS